VTLFQLFSEMICRIGSFAAGIKTLLFDKDLHILILTKKEPYIFKNTNLFTLSKSRKKTPGGLLPYPVIVSAVSGNVDEKMI